MISDRQRGVCVTVFGEIKVFLLLATGVTADLDVDLDEGGTEETPKVEPDLGASREGSRTDDDVVKREEEAIKIDGLNVAQIKELRDKAEKFQFQVFQLELSTQFKHLGLSLNFVTLQTER